MDTRRCLTGPIYGIPINYRLYLVRCENYFSQTLLYKRQAFEYLIPEYLTISFLTVLKLLDHGFAHEKLEPWLKINTKFIQRVMKMQRPFTLVMLALWQVLDHCAFWYPFHDPLPNGFWYP